MFRYFKQRTILKAKARALFQEAVAQARLPIFYQDLAVPDTVDGRFELITLHCYIIIHRLNQVGEYRQAQALFDTFFINMDQSLREMGVGDVGVPKHMKRMMQGFNGRIQSYEKAIKADDIDVLKQALIRNVYGTVKKSSNDILLMMVGYVQQSVVMNVSNAEFANINTASSRLRA